MGSDDEKAAEGEGAEAEEEPEEEEDEEKSEAEEEEEAEEDAEGEDAEGGDDEGGDEGGDDEGGDDAGGGDAKSLRKKKPKKEKGKPEPYLKRPWAGYIRDIQFTSSNPDTWSPFFHFTLGGLFVEVDHRAEGGGIELEGEAGPMFETDTLMRMEAGEQKRCLTESGLMKLEATYDELKDQKFTILCIHRPACCKCENCECFGLGTLCREGRGLFREEVCKKEISLRKLANGSVPQCIPIAKAVKGKGLVTFGELRFNLFFEEVFDFEIGFIEWAAKDLAPADDSGTSDPFIEFSIKGDWRKFFKTGGHFGRSCQSETEFNTLFPKYSEMKGPLKYNGTWSELCSEMLQVKIWHWDMFGFDKVIGWAALPLNGVFVVEGMSARGYIKTGLSFTEKVKEEVYAGKFEVVTKCIPWGECKGYTEIEQMPKYKQFGAPVQLKPGVKYLAIEVVEANDLPATDENGYTDCFFVIEWESMKQSSKVIQKSLNPKFGERMYFPILMYKFDEESLGEKEAFVKLTAFDYDEDGSCDFHGNAQFGLYEINDNGEKTIEDIMDTRILEKTIKLEQCSNGKATVTIRAWFTPKLFDEDENEIFLEAPKDTEKKTLPAEFTERATAWDRAIKEMAPRAHKKARRRGGFTWKALDERLIEHFLPEYLGPMGGMPLDLTNFKEVSRMVSSITFEPDDDTLTTGDGGNTWASPKFFLDVKKGASEDHAIMLCNMLLALGLDSYLCTGRAWVQSVDEQTDEIKTEQSPDEHVWVMVRWPDKAVSFFETVSGFQYRLDERWAGCEEEDSEDEEAPAEGEEEAEAEPEDEKFVAFFEPDAALELEMLRPDDGLQEEIAMLQGLNLADEDSDSGDEYPEPLPLRFPPYAQLHTLSNAENTWANVQFSVNPSKCMYEVDDTGQWKPFCSFDEGFTPDEESKKCFYDEPQIAGRLKQGKANDLAKKILHILKEGVRFAREKEMLDTNIWEWDPEADDPPQPGNIEQVLSKGLKLMEEEMVVEEEEDLKRVRRRLQLWKAEMQRVIPPNCEFEGIPINFSFADAKRIKNRILERFGEYPEEVDEKDRLMDMMDEDEEIQYAFGACCCPYYCGVNSTWIYVVKIKQMEPEEDE